MNSAESFNDQDGTSAPDRTHEWDRVEARAEDVLPVEAEVPAEDLLIDRAEIDVEAHVLRRVELREARSLPVQAALHRIPDEEDRRRGAVIGASARVLDRSA